MIVLLVICLCFYIFFRFRSRRTPRFLRYIRKELEPHRACQSNADCLDEDEVCHHGICRLKLRSGQECDSVTGDWTIVERDGQKWVGCTCRYPDLMGQSVPGGNCDVDRICGPVGHLKVAAESFDGSNLECSCPEDFLSKRNRLDGKPSCVKRTVSEKQFIGPCREDELDLLNPIDASYLKPGYAALFPNLRCVKAPCGFDALTNKPLKHAFFIQKWGCVCNPRRGNIGLRISDYPDYVEAKGYNACINIFENGEPLHDLSDVKLYTYFYIFDKQPMSFIQFSNLHPESLSGPFREMVQNNALQIEEDWPFDYTQYILKSSKYVVRIHGVSLCKTAFSLTDLDNRCREYIAFDYQLEKCKDVFRKHPINSLAPFLNHPICIVERGDMESTDFYDKRIVSNPLHITSRDAMSLTQHLSNGIELKIFDEERWHMDFAPTHSDYLDGAIAALVPDYDALFRNT